MYELDVRGIPVSFPFEAYDNQKLYMQRVMDALQKGENALLESPTGTGKTLCLLCATLAWRAHLASKRGPNIPAVNSTPHVPGSTPSESKLPVIIYSSRTHSQLQQVIRELKATSYRPHMCILGSREQMCVHKDVSNLRSTAQNQTCRSLVKTRACTHHRKTAEYLRVHPEMGTEPMDIEDLVKIGKNEGPCPYYISRELHARADIIFMPYNYLLEKEQRKSLKSIQWEDSVIIFDEAHNLEDVCADKNSVDITAALLAACVQEAKACVQLAAAQRTGGGGGVDPLDFATLEGLLINLEKKIGSVSIGSPEHGFTRPGSFIYDFLGDLKINHSTVPMLLETIDSAIALMADGLAKDGKVESGGGEGNRNFRLQGLLDAFRLIFRDAQPQYAACFKTHIAESFGAKGRGGGGRPVGGKAKTSRTLSWWCFNPGLAMLDLTALRVRSMILTSGTLSPVDSFANELKVPFPIRLENAHVISESQLWVGVLPVGPSGKALNSSYLSRDTAEYKAELGNAIVNFARMIPDGLLVFFPSYRVMEGCIQFWQTAVPNAGVSIWERILKLKQAVIEPRDSTLFASANEDFNAKLSDPSSSGAIFLAVCRGKVSEGMDFADRAGRGVIITGIPFAMKTDAKVQLKREYLDEQRGLSGKKHEGLSGEEWYVKQASRAVNQAVGRVIRHRHDYGAILLCDERFRNPNAQRQMSLWLRPYLRTFSKFGEAAVTLTKFFKERNAAPPPPKPQPRRSWLMPGEGGGDDAAMRARQGGGIVRVAGSDISKFFEFGESISRTPSKSDPTNPTPPRRSMASLLAASRNCPPATPASSSSLQGGSRGEVGVGGSIAIASARDSMGTTSSSVHVTPSAPPPRHPNDVLALLRKKAANGSALGGRPGVRHVGSVGEGKGGAESSGGGSCYPGGGGVGEERGAGGEEEAKVQKGQKAAIYLAAVKAELSDPEVASFVRSMKAFSLQQVSVHDLLRCIASLFRSPRRFYLLQRFGQFLRPEQQALLRVHIEHHSSSADVMQEGDVSHADVSSVEAGSRAVEAREGGGVFRGRKELSREVSQTESERAKRVRVEETKERL